MSISELEDAPAAVPDRTRQSSGRFLRRVWRTHFYAALLAAPVLVMFSITGLAILYTEPLQSAQLGALQNVQASGKTQSLDLQRTAAVEAAGERELVAVVPPVDAGRSTMFEFAGEGDTFTQIYVNPYTARVIGTHTTGDDLVGLANRLHGSLNNEAITVPLISVTHLFDSESPWVVDMPVSDIVLEIAAVWALVLALTGIYLWWPRRTQKGKRLLSVRWSKGGRLRYRDLHAASGILLSVILVIFAVSGMAWSNYWGATWSAVGAKVTPNQEFEEPASTAVKAGTLDRFGHRISWATREDVIPASTPTDAGKIPAALSLDTVVQVAQQENLLPGYSISMPFNDVSEESSTYGTYQLSNPWPSKLHEERTIYVDQFTGDTLAESSPKDWGTIQRVTELGVETHMGTQLGLFNRLLMTAGCLLIILSIASSLVLWWKRRPTGSSGMPERSKYRSGQKVFAVMAVVLTVIYPLWGLSLIAVLLLDLAVSGISKARTSPRA